MSNFLNEVAETGTRAELASWIRGSVGEMDRIIDDAFPVLFGENWRRKMSDFPTTARTKLLTYIFDHALEETARRLGIDYAPANNEGPSETNNFDCYLFNYQVENKLSLGEDNASFATGSSHNTENKVKRVLAVKVKSVNYRSTEIFACAIDLSDANNENTGWHAGGGSGFSALKIDLQDRGIVVPLCGDINARAGRNRKFVGVRYESVRARTE